jgi:hypothetical protein
VVVCLTSLHCSFWEVSASYHIDVISSILSGIQGDFKATAKRMALEQRQIQNRGRDAKLLLFLVNLWTQVRSQCFSKKAVWTLLTVWDLMYLCVGTSHQLERGLFSLPNCCTFSLSPSGLLSDFYLREACSLAAFANLGTQEGPLSVTVMGQNSSLQANTY